MKRGIQTAVDGLGFPVVVPEDNIPDDRTLRRSIDRCRAESVDTLLVTQPTISDGRLAPVLAQHWNAPLVLWATPEKPTGAMISSNSLVGTHVFAANLRHLGSPFELVFGHPSEATTGEEIRRAVLLTATAAGLARTKVGLFGYHAPGFIDLHADPVSLSGHIGAQLYHESVPEFLARLDEVSQKEIEKDLNAVKALDLPAGPITPEDLEVQSRYYLAIRAAMREEGLDALALRCWPDLPALNGHWPYLALSRLMDEGVAVTMEGDVDGALCSLIGENLQLGPVHYTDWLEHDQDTVTTWHTGAVPFTLCEPAGADGAPELGLQFNNKRPTVVQATLRAEMPVTLYRLWRCDERYHMTALEGVMVRPRRELMATNGLLHVPGASIPDWFDHVIHQGMPHHVSLIRDHRKEWWRRLARLMGWRWV
jgi:L-fucose isomerase-like protein